MIELDVFHGEYEGSVMAECEFLSEEVAVEYADLEWFDDEVTFDFGIRIIIWLINNVLFVIFDAVR